MEAIYGPGGGGVKDRFQVTLSKNGWENGGENNIMSILEMDEIIGNKHDAVEKAFTPSWLNY